MRDWKALAAAQGMDLKGADLERALHALAKLEEQFRPLLEKLAPEIEPAITFDAGETGA